MLERFKLKSWNYVITYLRNYVETEFFLSDVEELTFLKKHIQLNLGTLFSEKNIKITNQGKIHESSLSTMIYDFFNRTYYMKEHTTKIIF